MKTAPYDRTDLLALASSRYDLEAEETLRLQMLQASGYSVLALGVVQYIETPAGDIIRHTTQGFEEELGIFPYGDETGGYEELMEDLGSLEVAVYSQDQALEEVLYLYLVDPSGNLVFKALYHLG